MVFRFFFGLLISFLFTYNGLAGTIEFVHDENSKVELKDSAYPNVLFFTPTFEYPRKTVFELSENDINFYLLDFNSKEYYLWIEDLSSGIEIDLSNANINTSNIVLISKKDWLAGTLSTKNSKFKKLHEIDLFYADALDSLHKLAQNDVKYRADNSYNTLVWDSRSAKQLFNFAMEQYDKEIDENWIHYVPAYTQYWKFIYKLYYQYFNANSLKSLSIKETKSKIEADFNYPQSEILVLHHFFRPGLALSELKENLQVLMEGLSFREKEIAEASIQMQAVNDLKTIQNIDFLFGIDIDGALESYFARDSSFSKNVLVFWSFWDKEMISEFNLLNKIKHKFEGDYNFINICIDAYESPEKVKSFIYQNKVGGFHLLPEQSNAFRKSNYRKNQKIRDFPFYILTDHEGTVIETESVSISVSNRLEHKLKHFKTKK
ncbi:hypothetical protein ABWH96_19740 [Marivirga tractuosa]|uniref:hypothetical protein n=1 Tax=Marivirga tractuosa TaxID=1006 RepID=UPI0035D087E5